MRISCSLVSGCVWQILCTLLYLLLIWSAVMNQVCLWLLHSPSPPVMLGQLCSSAFPSQLPAINQCEHDNWLTKLGFINNTKFFHWIWALFTQRDQAGLCSFQPHTWSIHHGRRWPGTHCGQENGIPACYLVHDLPTCCAMQLLPLVQLI